MIGRFADAARTLVVAAAGVLAGCAMERDPAPSAGGASGEPAVADPVQRGAYLVSVLACNDCHTPFTMTAVGPAPDMTRMLSGHPAAVSLPAPPQPESPEGWVWFGSATNTAFAGPWGISYSSNLTPHETGLGVWSEEMFTGAMRTGKHMGAGRPILPPMPWPAYARLTDEDLHAVYAYLMSIPAIENAPPASVSAPAPGS